MTTRTIAGLFDTRAEAERAAEDLRRELALGTGQVRIHAPEHHEEGLLDWLARIWRPEADFMPPEDRDLLAEAIRHGGCVVSLELPDVQTGKAMDIMERHHPVDLDAHEAQSGRAAARPDLSATEQHPARRDPVGSRPRVRSYLRGAGGPTRS
ncbi:hypothetical protein [Falsiroseomonas sp.]|uniref:hypothetical protein n=1 Tax=Falsiroseomonas sp. TaxID=2870721 RepID=UPI0035685563